MDKFFETIEENKDRISKAIQANVLEPFEKGKKGNIGEIRTWGKQRVQKTVNGWVPVKESTSSGKKEDIKDSNNETEGSDGRFKDISIKELVQKYLNGSQIEQNQAVLEVQKRYFEKFKEKLPKSKMTKMLTDLGGFGDKKKKEASEKNKE